MKPVISRRVGARSQGLIRRIQAREWGLRFRALRLEPLEDRTLLSLTPTGSGDTADGAALLATSEMAAASTAGGANLALIETGLPGFLASLQDELNEVVFTAPAPLIGSQLSIEPPGQFIGPYERNQVKHGMKTLFMSEPDELGARIVGSDHQYRGRKEQGLGSD